MSNSMRRGHRWLGIAFLVTVLANFAYRWATSGEAPAWLTYAPLAPLLLQTLSGLYLFSLPYKDRWRAGRVQER